MKTTKSYTISKWVVFEAYKRVKSNRGGVGVDRESIVQFEKNLKKNLYKIWNRMSSGTYFPTAVRIVEIPKAGNKVRVLGIPTVADRVAQMVMKMYFEPKVEKLFHENSYGYRPNKSAIEAVGKARQRCWKNAWVVDLDIKGFFDNIDHELMMKAVRKHADCKWVELYIERWLKVPAQSSDGKLTVRGKGTSQGGVASPLLANLFLHYAFDKWMDRNFPGNAFERYADDIIVHCKSEEESKRIQKSIEKRMKQCKLELNMEKTKIVFCKENRRIGKYSNQKFDFLGYTFRPRVARNRWGGYFVGFNPAVSNKAKKKLLDKLKEKKTLRHTQVEITDLARIINPIVRGWINYFSQYCKSETYYTLYNVNNMLINWVRRKYKRFNGSYRKAYRWLGQVAKRDPDLFAHWKIGIKPATER